MSAWVIVGLFRNSLNRASAYHGGISCASALALIARAHGRASANVTSDIGATSSGRWHTTQLAYRMGATWRLNVGAAGAGFCGSASQTDTTRIVEDVRMSSVWCGPEADSTRNSMY